MQKDARYAAFVSAADDLFMEKGIGGTSVGDITQRVGVTRSLFYHYFGDKQGIVDAVIESRIKDFMQYVRDWTRNLDSSDFSVALLKLVGLIRGYLYDPASLGSRIIRERDVSLYHRFVVRSSMLISDYFVSTREERGALMHYTHVSHPAEAFYVLSVGIMSMMVRNPEVADEVIADIIAETLCIDMSQRPALDAQA